MLDVPTTDGETVIRLITPLPAAVRARAVARLYRKRWTIEGLFGRLEAAPHGEVRTLGYPRAALLAFGLAVIAFNVLALSSLLQTREDSSSRSTVVLEALLPRTQGAGVQ